MKLKNIKWFVVAAIVAVIACSSVYRTDQGYVYAYENAVFGTKDVWAGTGIHFRVPLLSKITPYKKVATIGFGQQNTEASFTRSGDRIEVRFADTYVGFVPASFRFEIDVDKDKVLALHEVFRSFDNLVDSMYVPYAIDVVVQTATQYTGEEFFQGGLNQFKAQLRDQTKHGVYVTRRERVEVLSMDLAPVSSDNSEGNALKKNIQMVWTSVIQYDPETELELRQDNPLDQYSLRVSQVLVGSTDPEKALETLLSDKKSLVAQRITAIQAQDTAREQAKTAQLTKEIEKAKAVQDALRIKELAVIGQQQLVEVAQQIAIKALVDANKEKDLAVVDKQKELEVAVSERNIQEANAEAAIFKAKAITAEGLAEATVIEAKYNAKNSNKEVYLAELQREVSIEMYKALPNVDIKMPLYMSNGGSSGGGSSVNVINDFAKMAMLDMLKKQAAETDTTTASKR